MGKRRMLSTDIICAAQFTKMPSEAQLLYMHLNSAADDDGFLQNAEWVCRGLGVEPAHLDLLVQEGYAFCFESGVFVLTHWNVNNQIRKDRYQPTYYVEEKSQLTLDERGVYQRKDICKPARENDTESASEEKMHTGNEKVHAGNEKMHTEEETLPTEETTDEPLVSRENHILCENEECKEEVPDWVQEAEAALAGSETESVLPEADMSADSAPIGNATPKKAYGNYENVFLTDEEFEKLKRDYPDYLSMIENLSVKIQIRGYEYQDHYAVMVKWAKEDAGKKKTATAGVAPMGTHGNIADSSALTSQKYDFEAMKKKARENLMRDGA